MSFFKRNKDTNLIPPVSAPEPKADPYAAPPPSKQYGGGDPYASKQSSAASAAPSGATDNPYAKRGGEDNSARNELFAGFTAPEKPKAAREYGYEGREQEEDFDEEEEVEGIRQEMRGLKQESLASTRSARLSGLDSAEGI